MRSNKILSFTAVLFLGQMPCAQAQGDTTFMLVADEQTVQGDAVDDATEPMELYEPLNAALGGDSVRMCDGLGCVGWVEDHYPNGTLKHRGYYKDGTLLVYSNYHPSGTLEREFKVVSNTKCFLRTYHDNGHVRSEVNYVNGDALTYADYYASGKLRYQEEKHPEHPYYKRMDLYAEDGKPISTLQIVDKKRVIFEQKEFWSNGQVKCAGRSQFSPRRFDSLRIGEWMYFSENGKPERKETYIDGKVHDMAAL
jgi:antitoxin component YwqK of YwqJK toxin-antitoxin module